MISVPRGKDDLSLYRGIPSPLALAPWGFGQLLPAVSFSSCEFCNEQRNVLSVSLHPFIFRKRHWSTRYTQFAMILAGVLLGQIPCLYAPFGANTAKSSSSTDELLLFFSCVYSMGIISPRRFIQFEAGLFSLRLGHGTALTCPRHVIHSRAAASRPLKLPCCSVYLL